MSKWCELPEKFARKITPGNIALVALAISISISISWQALAQMPERLVLSGFEAPGVTDVALEKLRAAYSQLGIGIDVLTEKPRRALIESGSGATDGEVVRAAVIETQHPDLIRVDVPVARLVTYAYTNRPEMVDMNADDLKKFRVGYVRGATFARNAAKEHVESWAVTDLHQLFAMLRTGRLELIIAGRAPARAMIGKLGYENDVWEIPASRRELPLYHYLHRRHLALVPMIEAELRALQDKDEPDDAGEADDGS